MNIFSKNDGESETPTNSSYNVPGIINSHGIIIMILVIDKK